VHLKTFKWYINLRKESPKEWHNRLSRFGFVEIIYELVMKDATPSKMTRTTKPVKCTVVYKTA